jgi:hypothetical protein
LFSSAFFDFSWQEKLLEIYEIGKMAWFCSKNVMNLKGKKKMKDCVRGGKWGLWENSRETLGVGMWSVCK